MKIQILQENLNRGLNIALRSISIKAQLPILANVLLRTDKNRLQISATNLETGISLWLGAKVEKEGEITIPAKILTEIIATLPPEKIKLEAEGSLLKISSVSYEANLNGISAGEFPKLPACSSETLFSLPPKKFLEAINQVAFAAATDEGRPILTGVLFKLSGKKLSLVATDGYRLSLKTMEIETAVKEEISLLLPAKTLIEVGRIITDEKAQVVQMGFTKEQNQVVFVFSDLELFSRVIEGEFPDYNKIIPQNFTTKAVFDKENFNRAVKVVSIFARDSANIIKIKLGKNVLEMSANSPQVGENKNSLEVKLEGEESEIAFNFRFMQSLLGAISQAEVSLEMTGPLNPGAFKAVGDDSFLHIIMPVRLQTEEQS